MFKYIALALVANAAALSLDRKSVAKLEDNPFANEKENRVRRAHGGYVRNEMKKMMKLKTGTTWYDHRY